MQSMADDLEDIPKVTNMSKQKYNSWKELDSQRKAGQFCDITFQCKGGTVSAHKCVLAFTSEYFKTLFTSSLSTASTNNTVVMDDFSVESMKLLMDIIYSETDVPAEHILELLRLADYVQLSWLVDLIAEEGIRKNLNQTSVFKWYQTAKEYRLSKLKFVCECYVRENVNKLNAKDVAQHFDSNILTELVLADPAQKREVVILNVKSDVDARTYDMIRFLVDPVAGKSENIYLWKRSGPTSVKSELARFWDNGDGKMVTTFMYHNVLYAVKSKEKRYSIWKLQQSAKLFEMVFQWSEDELLEKIKDNIPGQTMEDTRQVFYDNQGHLYIMVALKEITHCEATKYCIFKLDTRTQEFYKGYLFTGDRRGVEPDYIDEPYTIASLKDHLTCLVTPKFVYNLETHDFLHPGVHTSKLIRTDINMRITSTDRENFLPEFQGNITLAEVWWHTWDPCPIEGTFYCAVDGDCEIYDYVTYKLIFRLDMESLSWIHLDTVNEMSMDEEYFQKPFHCGSTLYFAWEETYMGETKRRTFYLDEKENKMLVTKKIIFDGTFDGYVNVPYHVLV